MSLSASSTERESVVATIPQRSFTFGGRSGASRYEAKAGRLVESCGGFLVGGRGDGGVCVCVCVCVGEKRWCFLMRGSGIEGWWSWRGLFLFLFLFLPMIL